MDYQAFYGKVREAQELLGGRKEYWHQFDMLDDVLEEVETGVSAEVLLGERPLRFWGDYSNGRLYVYITSLGPIGVVRSISWESAYEACEDEIMPGCTFAEMLDQCGESRADVERTREKFGHLPEGFRYRHSGEPVSDGIHGEICCSDLVFESLEELTPELAERLGLTVNVEFSRP